MSSNKPLQIFKPGRHTAMSGAALAFSESDLQASAAAYDPALFDHITEPTMNQALIFRYRFLQDPAAIQATE